MEYEKSSTLVLEAVALGRLGRAAEGDRLFERAISLERAPTAFARAWRSFERGAMWDRAGDSERARRHYRAALEVLPQHAHAAAHLASSLPPAEAEVILQRVLEVGDDPELMASLADVRDAHKPGSGDTLRREARRRYDTLVEQHPLAFADHAGWFYLAQGDVDRAVEIAEKNLAARQVPEAFELCISAQLRANEPHEACDTADRAIELAFVGPALRHAAVEAFRACGRRDRAREIERGADGEAK
jgi:tetratricopeptide (TPR) repeat protein